MTKMLNYSVDELYTIGNLSSFAEQVKMMEWHLRHKDYGFKNSRLSYLPKLYDEVTAFASDKRINKTLLSPLGYYEIKEALEHLMVTYKIDSNPVYV